MTRRIVWKVIGAAVIVIGITAAWAQAQLWSEGRGPIWFHHGPMGHFARALNLSDTQKSQVKSIWEGERPNIAELIHGFATEEKEMDSLTTQDVSNPGRIQDIATRQGATLAKLFADKEKLAGKIYSQVLNPAQRAKADEHRKRWNSHLDHIADHIGNMPGEK